LVKYVGGLYLKIALKLKTNEKIGFLLKNYADIDTHLVGNAITMLDPHETLPGGAGDKG